MAKHNVINMEKNSVGEVQLPDELFASKINKPLMHEVVTASLANKRAGTASTKTRAEVKASKAKPYRQKGTGRARHGSWVSPLFVGGGITFGPKPRNFRIKLTKKKKRASLCSALSVKVKADRLLVVDKWAEKKKTKEMAEVLKKLGIENGLIVIDKPHVWLERTIANIPNIDVIHADKLNTYDILSHDFLICTKEAVTTLQEDVAK